MGKWLRTGMVLLIALTAGACSTQSTGEQSGGSLPPTQESSLTSINPASDDTENGPSAKQGAVRGDAAPCFTRSPTS